ncbi:hypothetical protein RhiJN_09428 [Ceratobasidium sp. AG-Ba]|nr:hypothetical protein RhiJN_09428 [Ceratobasidium sp. AG-Ba]
MASALPQTKFDRFVFASVLASFPLGSPSTFIPCPHNDSKKDNIQAGSSMGKRRRDDEASDSDEPSLEEKLALITSIHRQEQKRKREATGSYDVLALRHTFFFKQTKALEGENQALASALEAAEAKLAKKVPVPANSGSISYLANHNPHLTSPLPPTVSQPDGPLIPKPKKSEYSMRQLREDIGCAGKKNKRHWLTMRAHAQSAISHAGLDLNYTWLGNQKSDLGLAINHVSEAIPELRRFDRNWAAKYLLVETFNHLRNYAQHAGKPKKRKKRHSSEEPSSGSEEEERTPGKRGRGAIDPGNIEAQRTPESLSHASVMQDTARKGSKKSWMENEEEMDEGDSSPTNTAPKTVPKPTAPTGAEQQATSAPTQRAADSRPRVDGSLLALWNVSKPKQKTAPTDPPPRNLDNQSSSPHPSHPNLPKAHTSPEPHQHAQNVKRRYKATNVDTRAAAAAAAAASGGVSPVRSPKENNKPTEEEGTSPSLAKGKKKKWGQGKDKTAEDAQVAEVDPKPKRPGMTTRLASKLTAPHLAVDSGNSRSGGNTKKPSAKGKLRSDGLPDQHSPPRKANKSLPVANDAGTTTEEDGKGRSSIGPLPSSIGSSCPPSEPGNSSD